MQNFLPKNLNDCSAAKIAKQLKTINANKKVFYLLFLLALSLFGKENAFGQYTAGKLSVLVVGDGSIALSGNAAPITIKEFNTTGTTQSGTVKTTLTSTPSSGTGSVNRALNQSGSATSEGFLNLSSDGRFLTMVGYNTTIGVAAAASVSTTFPTNTRAIGKISADGTFTSNTTLGTSGSGNNIRSAFTTNGSNYYVGTATTTNNIATSYVADGNISDISSGLFGSSTRDVYIFNNQLYISLSSGTNRVGTLGSGLPTSGTQTFTNASGTSTTNDPYSFVFVDRDGNGTPDLLYVASLNTSSGLYKYSSTDGGANWTPQGTLTGNIFGVTANLNASGSVDLYITANTSNAKPNKLYAFTDNGGLSTITSSTQALSSVGTLLATAATNTAFGGVTFSPLSSALSITNPGAQNVCTNQASSIAISATSGSTVHWTITNSTITGLSNTSGTGNISFTPTSTGTATVTAYANYGDKQTSSVSFTITSNATPSAPTAGNKTGCTGATIPNITTTPGVGETIDWYASSTGGSALSTGSTSYATNQTTAGTYTYYAAARNTTTGCVSARTAVTLTITTSVTPSVAASADDNTLTIGQIVTFTATPTNGGTSPAYQWYLNGSLLAGETGVTYVTSALTNASNTVYVIMTSNAVCASPATAQSSDVVVTVTAAGCSGTPNAGTTNASATNVCNGGSSNLSLSNLGTTIGLTYQWQTAATSNGTYTDISGATNNTYAATNITTALFYRCNVTCSNSNITTASNPIQITVTANVTPSVNIASSANPACSGYAVTITATPTNGGGAATYAWYKNTVLVGGQTTSTYSSSSFADGDQIYAVLTSSITCVTSTTAQSNTVTQNITTSVAQSVSIASSANPDCAGHSVTFTATPTNGGTTPAYQWYNGVSPISGATADTYSSAALTNGAQISVVMTSSITCVTSTTAASNTITQGITANVTPTVSISSNNNPVCTSGNATFTATPTNGGTPTYVWYLNNVVVNGQTFSSYTLSPVTNNDTVYAVMTSSVTCVANDVHTVNSSNGIKETIISPVTPSVTISASPGTTITPGTNITFTATPVNGGTPTYQWKLNGTNTVTTSTYSSSSFANNDVISLVITTSLTCINTATATSNNLTVTLVNGTPFTPGNIIVYRSGDSASNLVNTGNAVFLSEFTTSGALVQNVRLTKTAAGQNSIFSSGTASSEGFLNLSADGGNIVVPGYYSNSTQATSLTSSASATVNRVVAFVDRNLNIDTTTKLNNWSTGNNPRSVVANGNNIWVSGAAGGIGYGTKGAAIVTQINTSGTALANIREINIFNGQIYISSSSGTAFRLASMSGGLATTTGQSLTNIPGFATSTGSPYGFYFADLSSSIAGYDVVYVADDVANTITKYSLVSGSWTSNGTIAATAVRGLTGSVSGTTVSLFGTTGGSGTGASGTAASKVYYYGDASGYNGAITGTPTASTLVDRNAASFIAYRGICFAPTAITSHPSSVSICSNTQPTFTVAMVTGSSASIYTYQWQSFPNGGSSWSNVSGSYSGATSATLTVTDPTGLNGTQYRCVITYMGNTVFTSNAATMTVTDYTVPSLTIAADQNNVCANIGVTITATPTNPGTSPNYNFKVNGVSKQVGPGSTYQSFTFANNDVVTCVMTRSGACADNTNSTSPVTMIIKSTPSVPLITGGVIQNCNIGTSTSMYADGWSGTWSSSNTNVATVSAGPTGANSTNINALANGSTTISFALSNPSSGCASIASTPYTVAAIIVNPIVSNSSACVSGATFNATNSTDITGLTAVWATENNRVSISNGGVVTPGTSPGSGLISYTVSNAATGCSTKVTKAIIINALPAIPTVNVTPAIGASGAICPGRDYQFIGTPGGGVWATTATAGVATLSPTGLLHTVGAGSATLSYTSPANANVNGCTNKRTFTGTVLAGCFAREANPTTQSANTSINLFPNPTRGVVNLKVDRLKGEGTVVITDIYGKSIKNYPLRQAQGDNQVLDISNLSKGIYLLNVITSDGKTTKKLIVD